ncbi:MAG: hypothetical protein LBQ83_06225 [Candidatus Margulisbacteria bacterium]|jgi:type II secretory pathway pseudopilin PulG|nr:hypothetical protein [Candidatus Margulisiibacteriota bacterium]
MVSKKGFSLLELGLTLFILLLLGGAALTGLGSYQRRAALKFQQENISRELLWAKNYALTRFTDTDIIFFENTWVISAGGRELKNSTLPEPFTVSALRLGFNATGNPRYAGTLYLYRQGRAAAKMTVAVGSGLLKWTKL